MASVNISLTKEAYNYLKMLKGKDKSFSEVVLEIKGERFKKGSKENILRFAGGLKNSNINWNEFEKNITEFRKGFDKRVEETINYMEKGRQK